MQSFGARTEPPAHEQHTLRSSPDSCKRFRSQLADGCAAQQHPGEGFTTGPRRSHTRSLPSDRVRPPALLPRRSFYGTSPGLVPFPVEFQTTTQEAPDVRASILIEPLSGSMARNGPPTRRELPPSPLTSQQVGLSTPNEPWRADAQRVYRRFGAVANSGSELESGPLAPPPVRPLSNPVRSFLARSH